MKIIAEIGVNHNGSMELAKDSIISAKKAGADYVKFQIYKTNNIIKKNTRKVNYQKDNNNEDQYSMLKKLELSFNNFIELKNFAKKEKIFFFATAFDEDSFKLANTINDHFIKIPSGEIDNIFLLDLVLKSKKNILLSTGMCNQKEVDKVFKYLTAKIHRKRITIMQCTSEYPCELKNLNLNVIKTYRQRYNTNVGFSDHSTNLFAPLIAFSLGANIVEKHFTLDNNFKGPDHKASLNPENFTTMVENIKNYKIMLGNVIKNPTKIELVTKKLARKSLYAKEEINKGQIITKDRITVKRPLGRGISPFDLKKIINKKSKKKYLKNQQIIVL